MKRYILFLLFNLILFAASAQTDSTFTKKEYTTSRAAVAPKIDGILDDAAWENVPVITSFKQNSPVFGIPARVETEVKILYDNTAIYVCAQLYDNAVDSISKQLGNRDDEINADVFQVKFDTYNNQQDAYVYGVYASGVQMDNRFSDYLFNAVWESSVKCNERGWAVEMKIPYSAIRFPNKKEQEWGLQIVRSTYRNGCFDQWCLTPRGESNFYKYWGVLKGISDIKAPVRLALTPYLTAYASHYPSNIPGEKNYTMNVTGGLDLKYGLNESFTLDATLLPDFSQVQSDNVVKNLSAFEVQYDEQRPFFQENSDLFQKGGLFYSRRIGRQPSGYYDAYDQTNSGEIIKSNPTQAKLLNATKVSGRTVNGLGVGIMNAVMGNTYAVAKDTLDNERKILTEPLSNYNIIVLDQQMKHSSSTYLINTNVTREGVDYRNANVTGGGFSLNGKRNRYNFSGDFATSNIFSKDDSIPDLLTDEFGYQYTLNFNKTSGWFQFNGYRMGINPNFNNNALGITNETNVNYTGINFDFFQFEPKGRSLNSHLNLNAEYVDNFITHERTDLSYGFNANITFRNFWGYRLGYNSEPIEHIDYYEARTPGRIFMRPSGYFGYFEFNTDNRKKFVIYGHLHGGTTGLISNTIGYNPFYGANVNFSYRASDKLSLSLYMGGHLDDGDRGWVDGDYYGNIIFGVRKNTYVENILSIKYLFKNNLSLSLRGRHYWAKGHYTGFYTLSDEGYLYDNLSYDINHDFNFNAFNMDMVFQWQFAPGSSLNLVWKNSIYNESDQVINGYGNDLQNTFEAKQLNTVSLKLLYYFDYLYLVKKKDLRK